MKIIKIQMFPSSGEVNSVLNKFAEFIFNRKSQSVATEKKFVKELQSLSGITNSPMSLLEQRINNGEIDYSKLNVAKQIINEMKHVIKKHS